MANPIVTDPNYIATRDALIHANEGFSTNVYFDTNGIPTVGTGVALLTSNGAINTANMEIIANVVGVNTTEYVAIQAFAQQISNAVIGTPSMSGVNTANQFMASARGQAITAALGTTVVYVPGSSFMLVETANEKRISVTNDQALSITQAAINTRELQLDTLVQNFGGDPANMSIAERSVLMDVVYQYGNGSTKVITAVENFVNGGDDLGLLIDVMNAHYGERGLNDAALLFPNDGAFTSGTRGAPFVSGTASATFLGEMESLYSLVPLDVPIPYSSDSLASLLDSTRALGATEQSSTAVSIGEIRTLTGAQADGELWGGGSLLEFTGALLTDRYLDAVGLSDPFGGLDYTAALEGTPDFLGGFDLTGVDYSLTGFDSGLGLIPDWTYADTLFTGSPSGVDYLLGGVDYGLGNTSTFISGGYYDTSTLSGYGVSDYSIGLGSLSSWDTASYDYGFGVTSFDSFSFFFWPVVLDLDGDGVELVDKQDSRAYFDVDNDGYRQQVGWVGADDGFLTIDKNGDGKIDQADELSFALWSADQNDTDIEALKTVFDTNLNDRIDAGDAQFASLRVWQDKNGDGVTDAGELSTLSEAGITSVSLSVAPTDWLSGGNWVQGFTTFEKTDGTNGWAADVGFGYEEAGWQAITETDFIRVTQSGGLGRSAAAPAH